MYKLEILVPDETLEALNLSPEQMAEELRLVAAIKLFEMKRLSSGAAANLAGIPRVLFLEKLGDYGVPTFKMSEQELLEDLKHA